MSSDALPTGEHVHPLFGRLDHVDTVPPAVYALTDAVRELAETTVVTDVDAAERARVADEVRTLTARLRSRERPAAAWFVSHGHELFEHLTQAATGRANPHAFRGRWLHPDGAESFLPVPDPVTGESVYRTSFTGLHAADDAASGMADDGPIALLLDHVISFANAAMGNGGMTVALELTYAAPTPYGVPVLVRARRTHQDGRKLFATGEIEVDGVVTASARGVFISSVG